MFKASMLRYWASLVVALAAAFTARADAERSQPYAVIVGIGQYADPQIKPRPHAEADAAALYDLLSSKDYLGVAPDHMHLLLGKPDDKRKSKAATHDNILKAVHDVATKAGRDDLVIFAFIGEGAPLGDRSCYFASDSTVADRAKNAVAAADLEHELETLKSQRFCAFLDVNFKGFDQPKDGGADVNPSNLYKEFLGKDENNSHTGRVVFLVNRGQAPSLDLEKHGLFTSLVLDALRGSADKAGYEPDGQITIDELDTYLSKEIPAAGRKLGKTREEKDQSYFMLAGESSHFALTQNPAVTPKTRTRLAQLDEMLQKRKITPQLAEEGNNLLSRMPTLEAYRSLRKNYQKLTDGTISVEEFTRERNQLFEGMKLKRSMAFAFADKVLDAIQQVREAYIKDLSQGDMVGWAIRGLYQRIDEKMPQDVKDRLEHVGTLNESELKTLLADVREKLGTREDLDKHKDIDHALQKMLGRLDPYTTYIDPETLSQFERDIKRNYTGVGIQIRKEFDRDMIVVMTPIKGSPAYKAGIKAGDILTRIVRTQDGDGRQLEPPEDLSTKGMPLADVVKKVLGKPDTKVKLVIEREGVGEPIEFDITRSYIELETVFGSKRESDDSWNFFIDPETKVAYVRLNGFAGNTARDLGRVLAKLEKEGMRGLILDLRFNPGGLLRSAVQISDMFIDDGEIVRVKPRVGREDLHTGKHVGSFLDFPMVCLINGGSASASEIVSACLQDHGRCLIMGERSYGKGSVQNIQPFDGGQLKMTIASFWRPNGKNLNKSSTAGKDDEEWGVSPDKGFALKLPRSERDELEKHLHDSEVIARQDIKPKEPATPFKDRQLDMALQYLRGQIKAAAQRPAK